MLNSPNVIREVLHERVNFTALMKLDRMEQKIMIKKLLNKLSKKYRGKLVEET